MSTRSAKKEKSDTPAKAGKKRIRLRLNYRTVITVKSEQAARAWLERYPDAVIL